MQYFDYEEIFEDCKEELLKETGFESFEDYKKAVNSKKSDSELKMKLIQNHFKIQQEKRNIFGVEDSYNYADLKDLGMEFYINGNSFISIVDIFFENFANSVQDSIQSTINGQEVFKELIKRGANKEQVKLQLLMAEKELHKSLIEEKAKGKKSDKELTYHYEKMLKEGADYYIKLDKIKSPYDKMFDISQDVAELKKEEKKLLDKGDLSKTDLERLDRIAEEVEKKENWLAKEMSKYDPRIVDDVINDKIRSLELELEIDAIKKGKIVTKDVEASEITLLKISLKALKKQVNKDIKYIEQNKELNV